MTIERMIAAVRRHAHEQLERIENRDSRRYWHYVEEDMDVMTLARIVAYRWNTERAANAAYRYAAIAAN